MRLVDHLTILIPALLLMSPPVAVWRAVARSPSEPWRPGRLAIALFAPIFVGLALAVLAWLSDFSGQCGGWLGESSPCGFGQYAIETLIAAATLMVAPGAAGIVLGLVTLGGLRSRAGGR